MAVAAVAAAAIAAFPAGAAAHTRGGAPPATDWSVELAPAPAGVEASPVNGDLDLRLTATRDVEVLGALGEPMLRFGRDGVAANLASPTAHGDRIVRSGTAGWRRVASGRTYTWHEHRLHAAEPAGGGAFTIPLRIDGQRVALRGTLVHHDAGRRWPWAVAAIALLAASLVVRALRPTAAVATVAAAALRLGHAAHEHATADVVLTTIAAAAALALLVRVRTRDALAVTALAVGVFATAQAAVSLPVLWRAIALSSLGTPGARAALAVAFAAGLAAASTGFSTLVRSDAA
jgi:hypothetical protein